jgi:hypothetical protein
VRSLIEEGKKAAAEPVAVPDASMADDNEIPAPGGEVMPEPAHE